jgi:methyl-accepting chemotaxis protein
MEQEVKFVYTLDHSDVTNKAKDIKQEIHQNAKEVEKLGVTTDEFVKTVNELMSSFGKLTTAVDKNTEAQKKTGEAGQEAAEKEKKGADEATKSIPRTKEEADSLSGSFGKLTKYAAGFFTLQAAQGFIKKVFDVRSEIQSLHTSF